MIQDKFGQLVFSESDVTDYLMQGKELTIFDRMLVDKTVNVENAKLILENVPTFIRYDEHAQENISVDDFDHRCQTHWYMPLEYKQLDIAEYVLSLCKTEAQLQRVGEELLLFQERNLFDLLRYLKYLVDTLRDNKVIWGVGRGSSVASYVLYLLGVHRIDSMFYDLDPREFLR
jgi:DNA polymerase III alpha subunit